MKAVEIKTSYAEIVEEKNASNASERNLFNAIESSREHQSMGH